MKRFLILSVFPFLFACGSESTTKPQTVVTPAEDVSSIQLGRVDDIAKAAISGARTGFKADHGIAYA